MKKKIIIKKNKILEKIILIIIQLKNALNLKNIYRPHVKWSDIHEFNSKYHYIEEPRKPSCHKIL